MKKPASRRLFLWAYGNLVSLTNPRLRRDYDLGVFMPRTKPTAMHPDDHDDSPIRPWRLASTAFALMTAAYTLVFTLTGHDPVLGNVIDALINVIPLTALAVGCFAINRSILLGRSPWLLWPLQAIIALVFAATWYFLVTVLLGWRAGEFSGGFSVRPFSSVAFIWQVFQGVILYALVVTVAHIAELRERLATDSGAATPDDAPTVGPDRLLVRGDDDWRSVAIDDIVSVSRAGDYARIATADEGHLVRRSLADLLEQLPAERFLRVHRSHLVNLDAFESAESIGGGRLRVHLRGGGTIDTSRSGAQALRKRAG